MEEELLGWDILLPLVAGGSTASHWWVLPCYGSLLNSRKIFCLLALKILLAVCQQCCKWSPFPTVHSLSWLHLGSLAGIPEGQPELCPGGGEAQLLFLIKITLYKSCQLKQKQLKQNAVCHPSLRSCRFRLGWDIVLTPCKHESRILN